MNFKAIIVVGLSIATLGLSLPAHADDTVAGSDTATVIDSTQDAIVTGKGNVTGQSNTTRVTNAQSGRRTSGATGSSIRSSQAADVQGTDNLTEQVNSTDVSNIKRHNRR
jgi:microcystin-dependent protein